MHFNPQLFKVSIIQTKQFGPLDFELSRFHCIYGPQTISMRTVFRWVKAFKAGKFSVEDDTRPGRHKTSVTKAYIAAVKMVVEQDARLSVKDIASCTGISECSVQTILKKRLDLRKVCARWVPYLLTEEQKTQCLKCAWNF